MKAIFFFFSVDVLILPRHSLKALCTWCGFKMPLRSEASHLVLHYLRDWTTFDEAMMSFDDVTSFGCDVVVMLYGDIITWWWWFFASLVPDADGQVSRLMRHLRLFPLKKFRLAGIYWKCLLTRMTSLILTFVCDISFQIMASSFFLKLLKPKFIPSLISSPFSPSQKLQFVLR